MSGADDLGQARRTLEQLVGHLASLAPFPGARSDSPAAAEGADADTLTNPGTMMNAALSVVAFPALAVQDHTKTFARLLEPEPPAFGLLVLLRAAAEAGSLLWYLTEPAIAAEERAERCFTLLVRQHLNALRMQELIVSDDVDREEPHRRLEEVAELCDGFGLRVHRNKHGVVDRIGDAPPPRDSERVGDFFAYAHLPESASLYRYLCQTVHSDIGGLIDFVDLQPSGAGLIAFPRIRAGHVEVLVALMGVTFIVAFDRLVTYLGLDRKSWVSFSTRCAERLKVGVYLPTIEPPR
jgi:hypothetical protein